MKFVLVAATLLPLMAQATPVTIGEREWQQPDLLAGFSWNELASVCPTDGGLCSGSLAATDLTGWRWATVADVAALFSTFDGHPGNRGSHSETDSAWAPSFMSLFSPTLERPGASIVFGWTRSTDHFGGRYSVYMIDHRYAGALDTTRVRRLMSGNIASPIIGAWLYRDIRVAAAVPEPAPIALMALGFAGLLVVRRQPAGARV